MGNEGIYNVGKDLVKQNITFYQTKTSAGPLWIASHSHETLASQSRNPLVHLLKLDSSPISHTHPLQLNPHTYREND